MEIGELVKAADSFLTVAVLVFFVHYFMRELSKRDEMIAKVVRANTKAFNLFARVILTFDGGKTLTQQDIDLLEDDTK